MREIAMRLRAALTPSAAVILIVLLLIFHMLSGGGERTQTLESRASHILSCVDGAGEVHVTIRMKEIETQAFGTKEMESVPCGAVAVAQGADDPLVAIALHDALCALLGLPPASVSIMTGGR